MPGEYRGRTITTIDAVAFVPFNFYVVGFDQDGGYKGYEFEIQVSPTVTVLARVLNPPTALNVGSGDNFIVGTGGCVSGVGAVVLVDYQALVFAPEFDSPICVTNSTPSSFQPAVQGYLTCSDELIPFGLAENGQGIYPDGCGILGATMDAPVATENASWGSVKTRF